MSKTVNSSDSVVSAVRAYLDDHRAAFLDDLAEWLRVPSVSAQPDHAPDVRRSADWLAARLTSTGFPTVEVWETADAPAVFAEWPSGDPDAPTVLVYGHHDVQPAAVEDGWDTDPFEPVVRDNRLYARGAADDKGQVFFHTLGVRAHLAELGVRFEPLPELTRASSLVADARAFVALVRLLRRPRQPLRRERAGSKRRVSAGSKRRASAEHRLGTRELVIDFSAGPERYCRRAAIKQKAAN